MLLPAPPAPSAPLTTPRFSQRQLRSSRALTDVACLVPTRAGDDGVNLAHLLQSLFAREWANLCERVQPPTDEQLPIAELATWASDRAQVLSRTVRGVMLYADALRIEARLEGVPEEEIEALVASKFEYVVTCQIYAKLRDSKKDDDKACAEHARSCHAFSCARLLHE
jgi:hypothetical protein